MLIPANKIFCLRAEAYQYYSMAQKSDDGLLKAYSNDPRHPVLADQRHKAGPEGQSGSCQNNLQSIVLGILPHETCDNFSNSKTDIGKRLKDVY
jgi:hypothetical protein